MTGTAFAVQGGAQPESGARALVGYYDKEATPPAPQTSNAQGNTGPRESKLIEVLIERLIKDTGYCFDK